MAAGRVCGDESPDQKPAVEVPKLVARGRAVPSPSAPQDAMACPAVALRLGRQRRFAVEGKRGMLREPLLVCDNPSPHQPQRKFASTSGPTADAARQPSLPMRERYFAKRRSSHEAASAPRSPADRDRTGDSADRRKPARVRIEGPEPQVRFTPQSGLEALAG
jgi:hypothetical protein